MRVFRFFFFFMSRLPPRSTLTDTLFPYSTLFLSAVACASNRPRHFAQARPDKQVSYPGKRVTYDVNLAFVPDLTICASRAASQFVRRMQPWLSVRPINAGSGVDRKSVG